MYGTPDLREFGDSLHRHARDQKAKVQSPNKDHWSECGRATLVPDVDALARPFASHRLGAMLMPGAYSRPEMGQPSGVEVAFVTSDVPAAFARAVAAGATPLAEPKLMPWGATVAYLRAVEGTLIGLSTPVT